MGDGGILGYLIAKFKGYLIFGLTLLMIGAESMVLPITEITGWLLVVVFVVHLIVAWVIIELLSAVVVGAGIGLLDGVLG